MQEDFQLFFSAALVRFVVPFYSARCCTENRKLYTVLLLAEQERRIWFQTYLAEVARNAEFKKADQVWEMRR